MRKVEVKELNEISKKKKKAARQVSFTTLRFVFTAAMSPPPLAFTNHHAIETLDEMSSKTLMITL